MTDNELRGIVLQKFYERRREGTIIPEPNDFDPPVPTEDLFRICEQLGDHGLLDWKRQGYNGNPFFGVGKISAYGVDIFENNEKPPIGVTFSPNFISIIQSQGVQIGDSNVQNISYVIENFITRIEQASASEEEKKEAKSKLKAFLEHPLVTSVLGGLALKLIERLGR
jgi:hypothetical protein